MSRRGRDVMIDVLRDEGVTHVFGNPGTTELAFVDELAGQDDIDYVLALQEATVVGMADGYAQATGRPAFVNLHTMAGLGNAIGNLTNAATNGTPLVVTAGNADRRHMHAEPMLSGDLVGLSAGAVKWGRQVERVDDLGPVLRGAFKDAALAPSGPVFVALPADLLDDEHPGPVPPRSHIVAETIPDHDALLELAVLLTAIEPERLAIVAGDEVAPTGVDALVELAGSLGATVFGAPLFGRMVFPQAHPLWGGMLAPAAAAIASALARFDRVLLVGGAAFTAYPYSEGPTVPDGVELLHLSPSGHWLGRVHPTRLGLIGNPAATLHALLPLVQMRVDLRRATAARTAAAARREREIDALEHTATSRYAETPMHPMAAAHALVRALPPETPLVDEAITTGTYVRGFHQPTRPGTYFFCRGGGLGWGMPAACGVSLGLDREPVLCVVGDGAAMYSPQALWTAARLRLPIVFAIVNNRQYRILREHLAGMGGRSAASGRFVGMDLDEPPIDFVALATSMGVPAIRVTNAADVGEAVRSALMRTGPHLLELPIGGPEAA